MKSILNPILLVAAHLSTASAIKAGDDVCITGYIMDNFCINRGTLLDDSNVVTLENPEKHSYHCLLDVGVCIDSGYQVLGEKDPEMGMHCQGFRIDDSDAVLDAGRAEGKKGKWPACSTCEGTMNNDPIRGYRATVRGVVSELGDGSNGVKGTPILTSVEILDDSVVCEKPTIPPRCTRSGGDTQPPTPSPEADTDTPSLAPEKVSPPVPEPQPCPATLDKSKKIDDKATLYYAMVPSNPAGSGNGVLCARLEAENDGWVGLGISTNGKMTGSEAIVGIPDDGSVLKYSLTSKAGIDVMPNGKQTLRDTSVESEDEMTILSFTKLLLEDGEIAISEEGDNFFLHARGGDSLGYHTMGMTSFILDFRSGSPTVSPSGRPITSAPTTAAPSMKPTKQPATPILVTSSPSGSPTALTSGRPSKLRTISPVETTITPNTQALTTDAPSSRLPSQQTIASETTTSVSPTATKQQPITTEPIVSIVPSVAETATPEPTLSGIGLMPTDHPTKRPSSPPTISPTNGKEGAPTPSTGVIHSTSILWRFACLVGCIGLL